MNANSPAVHSEEHNAASGGGIHRLCHLISSREHGGPEKHVAELARWQAHHSGTQVSVIAHPRYQNTLDEKVRFIPLNTDRSRHHPTLIWRLANHIRAGRFQIVHGHGSKAAQLLAAVQKYTEARQVITRHNVRHPRDKLASAFVARIAVSESAIANSRIRWNVIPLEELPMEQVAEATERVYTEVMEAQTVNLQPAFGTAL